MSLSHEDLVAFTLGEMDAASADRIRTELESDPAAGGELSEIREHLALHEQAPCLDSPSPSVWRELERRIASEPVPPSVLQRFWMPIAAAALIAAAFLFPSSWSFPGESPVLVPLFGEGTFHDRDNAYTSKGVSRLQLGAGVIVTVDKGTTIRPISDLRLALEGVGRVYLSVDEARRGFTVEAGNARLITTGTEFLVEGQEDTPPLLFVVKGRVRYEWGGMDREIRAGAGYAPEPREPMTAGDATRWFRTLSIDACITGPQTIQVTLANDMPEAIEKAPPTGGEPFCYASYAGHSYPLTPDRFRALLTLRPGETRTFDLPLPIPVEEGQSLLISVPGVGTVEARR